MLSQLDVSKFKAHRIAVNNSERDLALLGRTVEERICVGDDRAGSGMDMAKGKQDFLQSSGEVLNAVKGAIKKRKFTEPDIIPVAISLGHGFGSGSGPEALKMLKGEFPNSVILAWVITPFEFQGKEIRERAYKSIRECIANKSTITPISNQVAAQKLGLNQESMSLSHLYSSINREISGIMTNLFSAFTAVDGVVESMDRNDLRKIWTGDSVLISMVTYPTASSIGTNSLKDSEAKLLVDVEYGEGAEQPTVTYIVDGPGELNVKQMSELGNALITTYRADMTYFKPLIVQRPKKDTSFITIRGNMQLEV